MGAKVAKNYTQAIALCCTQGGAGNAAIEGPGREDDAGGNFDVFVYGFDGIGSNSAAVIILRDNSGVPVGEYFSDIKSINVCANVTNGSHRHVIAHTVGFRVYICFFAIAGGMGFCNTKPAQGTAASENKAPGQEISPVERRSSLIFQKKAPEVNSLKMFLRTVLNFIAFENDLQQELAGKLNYTEYLKCG